MSIPRTGIGQWLITVIVLVTFVNKAYSGSITSVTVTFPNGNNVVNNTNTSIQCSYLPSGTSIAGVQFLAQKSGGANSAFFNYQVSPASSSSTGQFSNRASLTSATAGSVLIQVGPVYMNDESMVSCTVIEGLFDQTSSVQSLMSVIVAPNIPSLSFDPASDAIMVGSNLNITCSGYGGKPDATGYVLTKKSSASVFTHHTTTTITSDSANSIRSASYVYSGIDFTNHNMEILCVLNNTAVASPELSPNVSTTIDVKYAPENTTVDLVAGTNVTDLLPLEINCTADARPNATFTWTAIEGVAWFPIHYNGPVLQVPANTPNGTYVYNCTASNTIGGTTYTDQAETSFDVQGNCNLGTIPTSYTVTENNGASLYCAVTGTERAEWYYNSQQLTANCSQIQSPYTVSCNENTRQYNLTFTATWANRGIYTCSCFTDTGNVLLDVEVAIGTVTVTCIVQSTGQTCMEKALEGTDTLVITATTACTYPDPEFIWYLNQTEYDVSGHNVSTTYISCTGDYAGQRISEQSFTTTWDTLGSPAMMEVLVQRDRAASVLATVSFNTGLVTGFAAAKVVGLVLGVACAAGGITAGAVGLKKALGKNSVKPKPQSNADTETGEKMAGDESNDLTAVSA